MTDEAPLPFSETIKIAVYTPPNNQKTLQIRGLIERYGADSVGIVSAERGLNTIKSSINDDMVFVVSTPEDARKAYAWAKEKYNRPGAWVVIDGGSSIMNLQANRHFGAADACLQHVILRGADSLPPELKIYQRFITKRGGVWNLDMMAIYGLLGREAERFWDAWTSQQWHLYANFWEEKTGSVDRERVPPYGPDVPGRMGVGAIHGKFDYIVRLVRNQNGGVNGVVRDDPAVSITKVREDRAVVAPIPDVIKGFSLTAFIDMLTPQTEETQHNA